MSLFAAKRQERGGDQEGPHDKDGVGVLEGQGDLVVLLAAVVPVTEHVAYPLVHDAHLP